MDKCELSKLDAARHHLCDAVFLLFSRKSVAAVHLLTFSALQILGDHFDEDGARYHGFALHYYSPFVENGKRKEWRAKTWLVANFLKHAEKDKTSRAVFDERMNHFAIYEGWNMLRALAPKHIKIPEMAVFLVWFSIKYPNVLSDENKEVLLNVKFIRHADPDDYELFLDFISYFQNSSSVQ